jgi:hemoglobin
MTNPEAIHKDNNDIETRDDIERLVIEFYLRAFADPVLGRIFVDVAKMDLAAHLPHMCDFWQVAILRQGKYGRNAFEAHYHLNQLEPLIPALFQRWEDLWHDTVDDMFAGENANLAKLQASRISGSIQRRLANGQPANAIRLVRP